MKKLIACIMAAMAYAACELPDASMFNNRHDPLSAGSTAQADIPTGLAASAASEGATLSWNPVTGATSYNLYWSTDSGIDTASGTKLGDVTSPYAQSGLTNGTTYYWVATAVIDGIESRASQSASAMPQAETPQEGWTVGSLPVDMGVNLHIAYGNGKFVAVKGDSTIVATSTDGIAWTEAALPRRQNWSVIAFNENIGGGLFVLLANGDWTTGNPGSTDKYATSTDGVNWTERTLPISSWWKSLAVGGSNFVALVDGSSTAYSSPDGINWTSRSLTTGGFWYSVAGNGGTTLIAPNLNGGSSVRSVDAGVTWSSVSFPTIGSDYWGRIVYGNGKFIAWSGDTLGVSTDEGDNWTTHALTGGISIGTIVFGNSGFIMVKDLAAAFSTDGVNWTASSLPDNANHSWGNVAFGNGLFVIISGTASAVMAAP